MARLPLLLPLISALLLLGGVTAVPPALRPSGPPVNTAPIPAFSAPPGYQDTSAGEGGEGDETDAAPTPTELPGAEVEGNAPEHVNYEGLFFTITENSAQEQLRVPEAELYTSTHKKPVTRTKRNLDYTCHLRPHGMCCDISSNCRLWSSTAFCNLMGHVCELTCNRCPHHSNQRP